MSCRVCRARKVKCDGRPSGCLNCERLDLACDTSSGVTSPSAGGHPAQGPTRKKRTYRSCTGCRAAKVKCDGERPACKRCKSKSTPCVYNAAPRPFWAQVLLSQSGEAIHEDQGRPSESISRTFSELARGGDAPSASQDVDHLSTTALPSTPPVDFHDDIVTSPEASLDQSRETPEAISWLWFSELPLASDLLRRLADQYFSNVHPLRCFAFVHKPSFMQQLDLGFDPNSDDNALLHIVCAHGAKFSALEYSRNVQRLPAKLIQSAGHEWAKTAERLLLADYGKISVSNLMTSVLLYDYRFRLGDYAHSLMMSGFTTRMSHALQLNLEYIPRRGNATPSTADKEARRRLMWACYIIDAWTGSGVDQLTLIREEDLKIQLPCDERDFLLQRSCVTRKLDDNMEPDDNMGMMASYIRLVAIWKRVVRYVKHLDTARPPWLPDSEFSVLDADLRAWRDGLAPYLDFSQESIYTRLESSQLGALALLHCTYHNAMTDLYRVSVPELFKLRNGFVFPPEQADFLADLRAECFRQARGMATVLAETASRGPHFLADSMTPMFAYNSSRVMLYYLVRLLDLSQPDAKSTIEETIQQVQSNNRVLRAASAMMPLSEPLLITTERWLRKLRTGFTKTDAAAHIGPPDPSDISETRWLDNIQDNQAQNTPDDVLHPLSLFRLARKTLSERRSQPSMRPSYSRVGLPPLRESSSGLRDSTTQRDVYDTALVETTTGSGSSSAQGATISSTAHVESSEASTASIVWERSAAEDIALGLHDLQYYPHWDMDGILSINSVAMEDTGLAAWLSYGDR